MICISIFGKIVGEVNISRSPVKPEWRFSLRPDPNKERTLPCIASGLLSYSLASSTKATHALAQCNGIRGGALLVEYATAVHSYSDQPGFVDFNILGTVKRVGVNEAGRLSVLLEVQSPPVTSPDTHEVFLIPRLDLSGHEGRAIWATGSECWVANRRSGNVPIICLEATRCVKLDTSEIGFAKITPEGEALCRTR